MVLRLCSVRCLLKCAAFKTIGPEIKVPSLYLSITCSPNFITIFIILYFHYALTFFNILGWLRVLISRYLKVLYFKSLTFKLVGRWQCPQHSHKYVIVMFLTIQA